jgi:hypothetical protein
MEKKFANLGTMLSRAQAKKIVGGVVEEYGCSSSCLTHADCPVDRGCYSRECDEDKTKNYYACFIF